MLQFGSHPHIIKMHHGQEWRGEAHLSEVERILSFRSANKTQIRPFLLTCKLLKIYFYKEHCCTSTLSHFIGRYTESKVGEVRVESSTPRKFTPMLCWLQTGSFRKVYPCRTAVGGCIAYRFAAMRAMPCCSSRQLSWVGARCTYQNVTHLFYSVVARWLCVWGVSLATQWLWLASSNPTGS